jgi:hypothetical protein
MRATSTSRASRWRACAISSARNWTQAHPRWLAGVRFEQPATQAAFEDYRGAVDALLVRREQRERAITDLPRSPLMLRPRGG